MPQESKEVKKKNRKQEGLKMAKTRVKGYTMRRKGKRVHVKGYLRKKKR